MPRRLRSHPSEDGPKDTSGRLTRQKNSGGTPFGALEPSLKVIITNNQSQWWQPVAREEEIDHVILLCKKSRFEF